MRRFLGVDARHFIHCARKLGASRFPGAANCAVIVSANRRSGHTETEWRLSSERWIRCPDRWQTVPKPRRTRRRFDSEFKEQAARLVLDEGKSVGAVARDLDLTETALREWVKRAQADRTKGRTGLTTAERDELVRLRRALRIAEEERDILKKATAFFAKQSR